MIRESIARHLGGDAGRGDTVRVSGETVGVKADTTDSSPHASAAFLRLPLLESGDGEGACLIEPAVRCNHCGYCLSLGH